MTRPASERRGQVAPVLERGRRHGADQEISQDSARGRRRERQHQHAEQVEALAHRGGGARERENEDADEVED